MRAVEVSCCRRHHSAFVFVIKTAQWAIKFASSDNTFGGLPGDVTVHLAATCKTPLATNKSVF